MNGRAAKARRAWVISCWKRRAAALAGKGPIAKFIPPAAIAEMAKLAKVKAGDALFFAADKEERAATLAGLARTRIGRELDLIEEGRFRFCWVVDYPMYEWNEDEKRIDFSHNPFSMPQYDREKFLAFQSDRQGRDPGAQGLPVRHRLQWL